VLRPRRAASHSVIAAKEKSAVDRATRDAFVPYLTTYFREAFERGYL